MSEYLTVYIIDFHKGLSCATHKKIAGVYAAKKVAGVVKPVGAFMGAVLAALGINAWPKIEKMMSPYATSGAIGGGLIGAGMGMMKDSDIPKLDPNALATMTDQQREFARKEYKKQRRGEALRRGVLGGLKGGVGGATLGAVGAIGKGTYEQIQEEGAGALNPGKAFKTIGDWFERQKKQPA